MPEAGLLRHWVVDALICELYSPRPRNDLQLDIENVVVDMKKHLGNSVASLCGGSNRNVTIRDHADQSATVAHWQRPYVEGTHLCGGLLNRGVRRHDFYLGAHDV